MLRLDQLDYELPEELVAVRPAEPRDSAKLLVVSRTDPGRIEHRVVRDLPDLLKPTDLMVFNRSRVLPARFEGVREDTGGRVEGLYLCDAAASGCWLAMVRSRRFKAGAPIRLLAESGEPSPVVLTLVERGDDHGKSASAPGAGAGGAWIVRVARDDGGPTDAHAVLDAFGRTPLPPYIRSARKRQGLELPDAPDRAGYQTIYAGADDEARSVAAPTAGLHFTPGLLSALAARGIKRAEVLLHVGAGTFKPVETEHVEEHPMHSERCSMAGAGPAIDACRSRGGRIIGVGTTTARTLESFAAASAAGQTASEWLETDLLITPGFSWRTIDGLMTNFHQPRSTLMAMIAALLDERGGGAGDGIARLRALYEMAAAERYRFYSFGDAMLILP